MSDGYSSRAPRNHDVRPPQTLRRANFHIRFFLAYERSAEASQLLTEYCERQSFHNASHLAEERRQQHEPLIISNDHKSAQHNQIEGYILCNLHID